MVGKCLLIKEAEACDRIQFAHTSAVTAWIPIWSEKFGVLIPMVSASANVTVEYYVGGRFKFSIVSAGTVAKGDIVYYTVATDDVTTTAPSAVSGTTCFPLGRATEAGSATAGYVTVELFKVTCNLLIYKAVTAAAEVARIWGTTSATSGIFRGLSVRTFFTGAGTATGEALRVYNQTDVSIANMHGMHCTAQLGSETAASVGTVTGEASGVRATIGIGLTNTAPAGGTIASLRCDSYFLSTAAGAASSFIYCVDVGGSYGVDAIIRMGAIVGRTTSKTTMTAPYAYVSGKMTMGSASIALKIVTPDGSFYIPGLLASDYS
jgi:hypothetical protein